MAYILARPGKRRSTDEGIVHQPSDHSEPAISVLEAPHPSENQAPHLYPSCSVFLGKQQTHGTTHGTDSHHVTHWPLSLQQLHVSAACSTDAQVARLPEPAVWRFASGGVPDARRRVSGERRGGRSLRLGNVNWANDSLCGFAHRDCVLFGWRAALAVEEGMSVPSWESARP